MTKTAVVWTCAHADPDVDNERFSWLGNLLYDIKPDYCVDLGDGSDMRSLNSFDTRYPKSVTAQSYERDIISYHDSQERIRHPFRKNRRKMPQWIGFEGNHENRIKRAVKTDPRLEGKSYGISFSHLHTSQWFDDYHEYLHDAPAIATYDGVSYAHYFSFSNYGTAASGVHHAYTLVQNWNASLTCGHSHKRDMYFKDGAYPGPAIGLVAGCFKGAPEDWAGQANRSWWTGVIIKRNIDNGNYDPEFVSLDQLKKEYGK